MLEFGDGGVRGEGLPECGVLGAVVRAGGEEQAGWPDGERGEVGCVGAEGPCAAVLDVGEEACYDGAHAGAVLKLVVPDALEAGGEQEAGGGEHIQVE